MTRVKICCISSLKEAALAIDLGANAIGLVSAMPSGPGVISEERIAEIAAVTPPPTSTFLLTSKISGPEIIEQYRRCRVTTIQLCDRVERSVIAELRGAMPHIALVQVIHVSGKKSVDEALAAAELVDAILLDSGNQSLTTKELGGTGRTHDWGLSAKIVEESPVGVFLAGGLTPENIAAAIQEVQPFGVDVCSGVRTNGELDETKLRSFMTNIERATR